MNIKHEAPLIKKSRLENEVILAVVILYVLLSAALLLIHHMQPDEVETQTSSTSPAHEHFSSIASRPSAAAPDGVQPGPSVDELLAQEGYRNVRGLTQQGDKYHALAIREGVEWKVEVDVKTRTIAATPAAAR
jgi:hypothetical protein